MTLIVPIKRLAEVTLGKMVQPEPKGDADVAALYLRAAHVQSRGRIIDLPEQPMWFSRAELRSLSLRRGDVVVVEGGAGYGRSALVRDDLPGWGFQNSIVRLRPIPGRADGKYIDYAIQEALASGRIDLVTSVATLPHFTADKVSKFEITSFNIDEQRSIADFLDRETAQIDMLIAKQKRLIRLLKERRIAVRSALVTQGDAAEADLAPTDLVWAPRVPATWRVVPLTSIAKLESGHTPSRSHPEWWEDVYIPWISLNDVSSLSTCEYIEETVNLISDAGIANSSARLLPEGTVVLSRDATIGRSAIMKAPMATSQHFADWICGPALNPRYLWLLFTSAMQQFFDSLTDGSTIKTIGMGDLRGLKIPLPSLDEQARIVSRANSVANDVDALIAKAKEHIALAEERRAALIAATVTGQFDVRTARKAG